MTVMTATTGRPLVFATRNPGKLVELRELLPDVAVLSVDEAAARIGRAIPDVVEDADTFAGNASKKAREVSAITGLPALADDSGLCVDALHGLPGIFSARWSEDADGNRDWMRAMEKVWREVEATEPDAAPAAHFACSLAIAWPNDGQAETFDGRVDGTLVWPPRGDKGFGYDPMFVAVGYEQTFGELDPELKHRISHRAGAFRKLLTALNE